MVQILLIGLGAGAASALLLASLASGSPFAVLLFYLAPLPILIAALGWSHWTGLAATMIAAAGLAAVFGAKFFVAFLFGIGLPAWWLGYLALLARPAKHATPDGLEWYPAGRLVVWAAIVGALVVAVAAIANFGTSEESFRAAMRDGVERVIRAQTRTPPGAPIEIGGIASPNRLIEILVYAIPLAAATLTTLSNAINLWLAARVVRVSGRLQRPWPELSAMTFPPYAPILLGLAAVATLLPDLVGTVAGFLAASLAMAYAVLGFAVLHAITRGMDSRGFVLAGIYAAVAVFGWPVLTMTLLGLADTALDIRGRVARKRQPPTSPT